MKQNFKYSEKHNVCTILCTVVYNTFVGSMESTFSQCSVLFWFTKFKLVCQNISKQIATSFEFAHINFCKCCALITQQQLSLLALRN